MSTAFLGLELAVNIFGIITLDPGKYCRVCGFRKAASRATSGGISRRHELNMKGRSGLRLPCQGDDNLRCDYSV